MLARSNKTGADLKPAVVNAAMRTRGATQLTLPPLPATAAGEAFIDPGSMEADGAGDADCTLSGSHAAPGNGLIRALAFIDFYRAIVVAAAKAGEHPSTVKPEEPSRNVLESHILAVRQRIEKELIDRASYYAKNFKVDCGEDPLEVRQQLWRDDSRMDGTLALTAYCEITRVGIVCHDVTSSGENGEWVSLRRFQPQRKCYDETNLRWMHICRDVDGNYAVYRRTVLFGDSGRDIEAAEWIRRGEIGPMPQPEPTTSSHGSVGDNKRTTKRQPRAKVLPAPKPPSRETKGRRASSTLTSVVLPPNMVPILQTESPKTVSRNGLPIASSHRPCPARTDKISARSSLSQASSSITSSRPTAAPQMRSKRQSEQSDVASNGKRLKVHVYPLENPLLATSQTQALATALAEHMPRDRFLKLMGTVYDLTMPLVKSVARDGLEVLGDGASTTTKGIVESLVRIMSAAVVHSGEDRGRTGTSKRKDVSSTRSSSGSVTSKAAILTAVEVPLPPPVQRKATVIRRSSSSSSVNSAKQDDDHRDKSALSEMTVTRLPDPVIPKDWKYVLGVHRAVSLHGGMRFSSCMDAVNAVRASQLALGFVPSGVAGAAKKADAVRLTCAFSRIHNEVTKSGCTWHARITSEGLLADFDWYHNHDAQSEAEISRRSVVRNWVVDAIILKLRKRGVSLSGSVDETAQEVTRIVHQMLPDVELSDSEYARIASELCVVDYSDDDCAEVEEEKNEAAEINDQGKDEEDGTEADNEDDLDDGVDVDVAAMNAAASEAYRKNTHEAHSEHASAIEKTTAPDKPKVVMDVEDSDREMCIANGGDDEENCFDGGKDGNMSDRSSSSDEEGGDFLSKRVIDRKKLAAVFDDEDLSDARSTLSGSKQAEDLSDLFSESI